MNKGATMPTFRDSSRREWSSSSTQDDINAGSLQRIADATELIANNYSDLLRAKEQAEKGRDCWMEQSAKLERRISALRGVITKMKNTKLTDRPD